MVDIETDMAVVRGYEHTLNVPDKTSILSLKKQSAIQNEHRII